MALSKANFQAVATKLFAKAKSGDLLVSGAFKLLGAYDPVTETSAASVNQTIDCIREEFAANEKGVGSIQRDDFKLLARHSDFTLLTPRIDGVKVTVIGLNCSIVSAGLDAADAVYTIHVRAS